MPVNVVFRYPPPTLLKRSLKLAARSAGFILISIGLIVAAFLLVIIYLFVMDAVTGSAVSGPLVGRFLLIVAVILVIIAICLFGGRALLRGKLGLVLFLRRFGFVGATQALTFALATAIGGSWRLVTLDDSKIAPVGVAKGLRRAALIGGVVTVLVIVAGLSWSSVKGLLQLREGALEQGSNDFLYLVIVLPSVALSVAGAMVSWGSYLVVRHAETYKRIEISNEQEIELTTGKVVRRYKWILSPKLFVVRVSDAVWKETVSRFTPLCCAVIIDISEPTENLLWEIEGLKSGLRTSCILVSDLNAIEQMTRTATRQTGSLQQRMLELIDGEDVLVYSGEGAGRKRFARALRAKLERIKSGARQHVSQP